MFRNVKRADAIGVTLASIALFAVAYYLTVRWLG